MAVPLSAVIRDPQRANGFAVMVAEGGSGTATARLRAIVPGDIYGNMIAAKGGLNPGESVVTSGVGLIKNGDKVRIIP
jgi:multidrug efflux pump subunit AcrA (membrane-fusion protein)